MSNKVISLIEFALQRPEKIRWRFPHPAEEVLPQIKSKSLRKLFQKADQLLAQNQIRYELKVLDKQTFLDWLPYYTTTMSSLEYDILASEEWFDTRTSQGLSIEGLFFYRNEKLVGSGILTIKGKEKATLAFKASERLDLSNDKNSSLGAVIDYLFIETMHQRGIQIISAGRSRNAFGVINTLGYLDYKLRLGYEPELDETLPLLTEVEVNSEGVVLFYGVKNNALGLYALKPKGTVTTFEAARFATPDLPFVEIEY